MHFISARIWHIRENAKLGEQRRLHVSIYLVLHCLSIGIGLNSIEDPAKSTALIVLKMNDQVLHLWHDIQVKLWVDLWP